MQPPSPQILLSEPVTRHARNDAIIYLVVAGVVFLTIPIFAWNRDRRSRLRDERNRKRAVVQSIIAKQAAVQMTTSKARSSAVEVQTRSELVLAESVLTSSRAVEPRKNSKSRSSSACAPTSRSMSSKGKTLLTAPRQPTAAADLIDIPLSSPPLKSIGPSTSVPTRQKVSEEFEAINLGPISVSVETSNSSVAPNDSEVTPLSDNTKIVPFGVLPAMVHNPEKSDQAFITAAVTTVISPPVVHHVVSSRLPGSPSSVASSSDAALGVSTSSATAPLTPASIPAFLYTSPSQQDDVQKWDGTDLPSSNSAWDWDGQHSPHSSPKSERLLKVTSSPSGMCQMPSLPSLVFPTLNDDPPPGASPGSQIAMLKAALETSRENEKTIRREAERHSKECELMKWRWTTSSTEWQRREALLQRQINSLIMQLQVLSMQAPHFSSPSHYPLAMQYHPTPPFPPPYATYPQTQQSVSPLHSSPVHPLNSDLSDVSEELAEAILRRPESIRSSVSRGRRRNEARSLSQSRIPKEVTTVTSSSHKNSPTPQTSQIEEFEFPTLLGCSVSALDSLSKSNTDGEIIT